MASRYEQDKTISTSIVENSDAFEAEAHLVNQEDHEETVKQALSRHKTAVMWCIYAIWVLVITSFDNQVGGAVVGIPQFRKDFGYAYGGDYVLPAEWQSAYTGGPVATSIVGTLFAGYLADKIGRKFMYMTVFFAKTNAVFFIGKMINGFAVGGFITTSMTYIGEVVPLALRGVITAAAAIAFTIGPFVVALILNTYGVLETQWSYRGVFIAQYGITAIGAVLIPFLPESPWWLMSKDRRDKAARSLRKLGTSESDIPKRLAYMDMTLNKIREETAGVTYMECFRKSNLRRTMVAIAPLSIQALGGVFFVAAFYTYYAQLAGFTTSESFKLTIGQQVCSLTGNITSWFLIDRVGRRNLTFYGVLALTVLLLLAGGLATAGTPGAVKGCIGILTFYCYLYNATIGATAYSAITEIATSRLRAKTASIGLALQNALFTMWGFVIPYVFNSDKGNLGGKTSFIFGGLAVFCCIYLYFCHPEVSGRSYEEIDEMFVKRVPARQFKTYVTEVQTKGPEAMRRASAVSK